MPRKAMRDVVVCLPGITGSVLRKDGRDVWNVSGGALLGALSTLGRNIQDLKLEDDAPDVDDLGDGITAPEVIRDVHLVPGLWKIDGYTKMLRYIESTFDVTWARNLFEFPYDWRRDNRVAARRLQRKARGWLDEWRRSSGAHDAKLILVGHSMGGLVARYFLDCLEGWRDTRALVTIGTPYRGSLDALGTLVNGKRIKFFDLTEVARSLTALYQLLPTYRCYDPGDGVLVRVHETEIPQLDRAKATAAYAFHQEIADAVETHLADPEYRDGRYRLGRIVGIRQPTNQSAVPDGGGIRLLRTIAGDDPEGDGTVPRPSATPIEHEGGGPPAYSAERHASLQNDDHNLLQLYGVLSGIEIDWGRFKDAVPMNEVSLDVADLYGATEPIVVRARPDREPRHDLMVEMVDVESGVEAARQPLAARDGDSYEATLGPLPEGVYRVTVYGSTSVEPVSDLVVVLAE